MTALALVLAWFVVSVPVGLLMGAMMRRGSRGKVAS